MNFPERPTCHDNNPLRERMRDQRPVEWQVRGRRDPYDHVFRQCSFCGSIHPEDLLRYLESGARLVVADFKYGWPHKFYVEEIPNPLAGQIVECGSSSKDGVTTPIMGEAPPHLPAKWYNQHLTELDGEAFLAVAKALEKGTRIEWTRDEKGTKWRCIPPEERAK